MAEIMIKCPVTNHAISTGIEVASDADFNSLLNVAYHIACPSCGGNHTWYMRDAWIADQAKSHQLGADTERQSRSRVQ